MHASFTTQITSREKSRFRGRNETGSVLITASVVAAILSLIVVSYLAWVTNEYRLGKRSHAWTQTLNLCEAGIELGMAELNFAYRLDPSQAFRSSEGWSSASNNFTKTVENFGDANGHKLGSFSIMVSGVG